VPNDLHSLINAIALSPLAMVVSNPRRPDNPLELANGAFCDLTLYPEAEIVGRNCRFLSGERTQQAAKAQIRTAIGAVRPVLADILNYRRDGSAFRNGVMITPLFDDEGKLAWFLGSQVDLGDAPADALADRRSAASEKVKRLPPRQRQVLAGMARGLLNKQIAWDLKISEKTVKMHRALLLERLGVGTSAEAIRVAVEAGL
jgi:DNA-binding CsgD family transcriptional regulator